MLGSVAVYIWYLKCAGEDCWNWLRLGLFVVTFVNCLSAWLSVMLAQGKIGPWWMDSISTIDDISGLLMFALMGYVVSMTATFWASQKFEDRDTSGQWWR